MGRELIKEETVAREDVCNKLRIKYGESIRDVWLYPDLLDAHLKIQELEAELTMWRAEVKGYASDSIARQKKYDAVCIELSRLKEEHEKEWIRGIRT